MRLAEAVRGAFDALRASPLRSILTTLGITIGTAAILAVVCLVGSAKGFVSGAISSLGDNLVVVWSEPYKGSDRYEPLTPDDLRALLALPDVERVAPGIGTSGKLHHDGAVEEVKLVGVRPDYPRVRTVRLACGRFVSARDVRERSAVAVVDNVFRQRFFPRENPVGRRIRIDRTLYTVVGVLEKETVEDLGNGRRTPRLYAPITFLGHLKGSPHYNYLLLKGRDGVGGEDLGRRCAAFLAARHGFRCRFGYEAIDMIVRQVEKVGLILTVVMGAVAAVALVVGGVGVMNVMLMAVVERTREIGIRKALGATERDLALQFLFESVTLSTTGGLLGVVIGLAASWVGVLALQTLAGVQGSLIVPVSGILAALGATATVGLAFGTLPACRAARLDPIVCLRYE